MENIKKESDKKVVSLPRRELLKKLAYIPPTLVVLGVLTPQSAGADSPPPPPTSSPDQFGPP